MRLSKMRFFVVAVALALSQLAARDASAKMPEFIEGFSAKNIFSKDTYRKFMNSFYGMAPTGVALQLRDGSTMQLIGQNVRVSNPATGQTLTMDRAAFEQYMYDKYVGPYLSATDAGVFSPVSAPQRMADDIFDSAVLPPATPTREEGVLDTSAEIVGDLGAGLRYQRFQIDRDEATVYGAKFGFKHDMGRLTLGASVPYDYMDLPVAGAEARRVGLDLSAAYRILSSPINLKAGGAVGYNFTDVTASGISTQQIHALGFGPFVSVGRQLGPIVLTGGWNYMMFKNFWGAGGDPENHLMRTGANVALLLGDHFSLNVRGMRVDVLKDTTIDTTQAYYVVGPALRASITTLFAVEAGYRKILGCEHFDSDEIFASMILHF